MRCVLWSVARSRPGQPLLAVTHRISLYDDVSCVSPDANYGKVFYNRLHIDLLFSSLRKILEHL